MLRRIILSTPLNLTAVRNLPVLRRHLGPPHQNARRFFSGDSRSSDSSTRTRFFELDRVESLVDGCDYQHWLVVMHPPNNYPQRDQIIQQYIETLATVLGSEEAAKKSIYSVSTKYYYAFSCKLPENMTHKIKSLPRVKWVLPDSYLSVDENGYGGEPFSDGKVVPYDEKYHAHWLRDEYDDRTKERTRVTKPRRKRKGAQISHQTNC